MRYSIHLAANDEFEQTLHFEAELVENDGGYNPDPTQPEIEVTWAARGESAVGLLYIDADDTANEIVWSNVDANVSKTSLLARAPNNKKWRRLMVGARVDVAERGVGYPAGIYVVQSIKPV